MALIQCPNCKTLISDEYSFCPECGSQFRTYNAMNYSQTPQYFGYPPANVQAKSSSSKKVIVVAIAISAVLILAMLLIFGLLMNNSSKQNEARSNEIYNSKKYEDNLKAASDLMFSGALEAEKSGNLIKAVWYNTISEKSDPETDKYTKSNGYSFNDDFNDSLVALFSDYEFIAKITNLKDNQNEVANLIKELKNPPDEYEDAYETLMDYYSAYLTLTDLVINPSGSYTTYSSNFTNADSEAARYYKEMQIYFD